MLARERLRDGTLRLQAPSCAILLRRLGFGALLLTFLGDDDGTLGDAPFGALEAELGRGPCALFIDTRDALSAADSVRDTWSGWLVANAARFSEVAILLAGRSVPITIAIARLVVRARGAVTVHWEQPDFERAIAARVPGFVQLPDGDAPPYQRRLGADGVVRLISPECTFTYRRPRAGLSVVTISGDDRGQFGTATLDELRADLGRSSTIELFVDTSDARGASTAVAEAWTEFFRVERARLRRVHILVSSKFVSLTISVAQLFSRTGEMIRIYSDRSAFDAALGRALQP